MNTDKKPMKLSVFIGVHPWLKVIFSQDQGVRPTTYGGVSGGTKVCSITENRRAVE
jgi:hypothetical protein